MSFADKHILFGGAVGQGWGTPWGTLGEIVASALAPLGYEVTIEGQSWGPYNVRYVGDGRVDFGATTLPIIRAAYRGEGANRQDGPRGNLRVIACINQPGWVTIAVRAETGITDLRQIAEREIPLRVYDSSEPITNMIWDYYGLSRSIIRGWGGKFLGGALPIPSASIVDEWVRSGDFDVIVGNIYTGYAPEVRFWHEASILYNLRFLPLPQDLLERITQETGGQPGLLPHHLIRGVDHDIAAVEREPQAIYGRDDMPDDFVYLLARTLDESRALFRRVHLPYSYDPKTVGLTKGVPLHPAAQSYYEEMGFPIK